MKPWDRIDYTGTENSESGILRASYREIWDLQKIRVDEVASGQAREAILFCEHEPVVTAGRRTEENNIPSNLEIPVFEIERGGDATWHGPGQLTVYPILRLNGETFKHGLHEYLRFCEESIIQSFLELGLETGRFGPTGVWLKRPSGELKKVASIGVAVRRWVTYHGLAINLSNSFEGFKSIRPCNFDSNVMTSARDEGIEISIRDFADLLESKMWDQLKADQISSLVRQKTFG